MSPATRLIGAPAAILAALALAACGASAGHSGTGAAASAGGSVPGAKAGAGHSGTGAGPSGNASPGTGSGALAQAGSREVADPQEAQSFPAPASARRQAAATPSKASKAIPAAGALSNAEVATELAQVRAVERSSLASSKRVLTPVPGGESISGSGALPIPAGIPETVQKVIAGANEIADFPYVFGGGHVASFVDSAYDCSGSVSYALAAGGLIGAPATSGELEHWGAPGPGRYLTVYANAGHTYMYVDGVLYDTAGRSGVYASRWQVGAVDNSGYVVRHWPGL